MPARKASRGELVERVQVLDSAGIARALERLASEIAQQSGPAPYLVGIRTGGAFLAERLVRILSDEAAAGAARVRPSLGVIDITLYRDDAFLGLPKPEIGPTELPELIEGRTVVLVDDVLYTGRTVRAAMDVLLDYGRPRKIELAVLIDRGCRELPIAPNFVGLTVTTHQEQSVRVELTESGAEDRVIILERAEALGQ